MSSPTQSDSRSSAVRAGVAVLVLAAGVLAYLIWGRLLREESQPRWITAGDDATRFKYQSLDGERHAGIPYWVLYVLPTMFPEKLPDVGGYAALGLPWESGKELPIGLSKTVIGYPRVGINCALCHTTRYRKSEGADPIFVPAGPGHTGNVEGLFRFLADCARDPRFNSDNVIAEIETVTHLDRLDRLLYRFVIIPGAKRQLLERGEQFAWTYRPEHPALGKGRDDPTSRYAGFLVQVPAGDAFGSTQFPPIWNLAKYEGRAALSVPQRVNLTGDTQDVESAVVDSALGLLGSAPRDQAKFRADVKRIITYLRGVPPPKYPYDDDVYRLRDDKVAAGKLVFDKACASCHAPDSSRVGRSAPIAEIGTDPDELRHWSKAAAAKANRAVLDIGIERAGFVEEDPVGYRVPHLDGLWLRAPYLHNGSVPSLWDLLQPSALRPPVFYRGYDVFDPKNVGFVSSGPEAAGHGTRFDTGRTGNSNQGHQFGAELPEADKWALIEYLKSL